MGIDIKDFSWYKVKNKRGYSFLRNGPEENGDVIAKLYNTYNVQVLDEKDDMIKVYSPDLIRDGWMKREDVAENDY